jgi:hypothetical protein
MCTAPHQLLLAEDGEQFFRDLTENGLRRGVFRGVEELISANRRVHRPPQRTSESLYLDGQGRGHTGKGETHPQRP